MQNGHAIDIHFTQQLGVNNMTELYNVSIPEVNKLEFKMINSRNENGRFRIHGAIPSSILSIEQEFQKKLNQFIDEGESESN